MAIVAIRSASVLGLRSPPRSWPQPWCWAGLIAAIPAELIDAGGHHAAVRICRRLHGASPGVNAPAKIRRSVTYADVAGALTLIGSVPRRRSIPTN